MSQLGNGCRVVLCTASPENGEKIAKSLVEEHLAACINISPVRSCYLWEGQLNLDHESLLIIKTEQKIIPKLSVFYGQTCGHNHSRLRAFVPLW